MKSFSFYGETGCRRAGVKVYWKIYLQFQPESDTAMANRQDNNIPVCVNIEA